MLLVLLGCYDADGDGFPITEDCDDEAAGVYPDAAEACDGVDQDCDGQVDEQVGTWLYADEDLDGFGGKGRWACEVGDLLERGGDCDDGNEAVYPGAPEPDCADPVDYNCDGSTVYRDKDGDGAAACEDCDDHDRHVLPGAEELCNGVDDDCDGLIDYGPVDAVTWYPDEDGDGYGRGSGIRTCEQPEGYVDEGGDCDDSIPTVNPGEDELCDDADQDCDEIIDEEPSDGTRWYLDEDGDGYGAGDGVVLCEAPSGMSELGGDCDDGEAEVSPGAPEICDHIDNDCDGSEDFDHWVPTDFSTIQDAIDGASSDEHICVEAGTWWENLDFGNVVLAVEGAPGATINGNGDSVATFQSSAPSTLMGFTLTGGEGSSGAAIFVDNSDPVLRDLVIENNICPSNTCRGVVHLQNSDATLEDVLIQDNWGGVSGGTVYGVGLSIDGGDPSLDRVQILSNEAVGSSIWAAGLYATKAGGVWNHLDVRGNTAESSDFITGVGLSINYTSYPSITNFVVAGNTATAPVIYSTGVWCYSVCSATLVNGVIHANEATGNTIYGVGASSYYFGHLEFLNVSISDNHGTGGMLASGVTVVNNSTASLAYGNSFGNDINWFGLADPTNSNGNIAKDPAYTDVSGSDPEVWDFVLGSSSSLIDVGDPNLSDPDGSRSDIGAHGGPGGDW